MSRFTKIKLDGLSEVRRMPRLGKVRLGKKVQGQRGMYPTEVDYFVFDDPAHVAKLGFADNPQDLKAIDVMLPSESLEENFPCALKSYKASGLFCEGDGEAALRRQPDGSWKERECPCELLTKDKPECKATGVLNIMIPKISVGGVFQIVTGSKTSIMDVQSGIEHVRELIGRVKLVPLKLERVPTEITYTNPKTKKTQKQKHYTLRLTFPFDIDFINKLKVESNKILAGPRYMLPAPDDLNPYADPPDLVETEEGEIRDAQATVLDDPPAEQDDVPKPKPKPKEKPKGKKGGKKGGKKSAEKPKKETAKTDATAESPPQADSGPEVVEPERVKAFWLNVQRVFGPGDEAKSFMGFFVKTYCGAESSQTITRDVFDPQEAVLDSILKTVDEDGRRDAAAAWWDDLQHQMKDGDS